MIDLHALHQQRLQHWRQTPATHLDRPEAARQLIERLGLITLFPASPEIPNLFHAYVGDPHAKTQSEWDSPSGEVYTWRWVLGRQDAGFYTAIVRSRPTWVHWDLLPAILRLRGEMRTPDELYDAGILSGNAYRIAQALEEAGGVLSTGDLRRTAGFPTGKEFRAAYLKAVEELDTRLMLAKVFSNENEEMSHALVALRYPEAIEQAEQMSEEEALHTFLSAYLPQAVYAVPAPLARHLKLDEAALKAGLDKFVQAGRATATTIAGQKGTCYVWHT